MDAWLAHGLVGHTPLTQPPAAPPVNLASVNPNLTGPLAPRDQIDPIDPPRSTSMAADKPALSGDDFATHHRADARHQMASCAGAPLSPPKSGETVLGLDVVAIATPAQAQPQPQPLIRHPRQAQHPPSAVAAKVDASHASTQTFAKPPTIHEAHVPTSAGSPGAPALTEQLAAVLQRFGAVEVTGRVVDSNNDLPTEHRSDIGDSQPATLSSKETIVSVPAQSRVPSGASSPVPIVPSLFRLAGGDAESIEAVRPNERRATVQPPAKLEQVPTPQAPIRVHADWTADGVRLWLGMDAGALDSLHPIAEQLRRWLVGQGHRLLSIHCNGRLLGPDPPATDGPDTFLPRASTHPSSRFFIKEVP